MMMTLVVINAESKEEVTEKGRDGANGTENKYRKDKIP